MTSQDMHNSLPKLCKGTILHQHGVTFKLLEDTTPHGCPFVEIVDPGDTNYSPGDRTYRTLYQELINDTDTSTRSIL